MKRVTAFILIAAGFALGTVWTPAPSFISFITSSDVVQNLGATLQLPKDHSASTQISSTFVHAAKLVGIFPKSYDALNADSTAKQQRFAAYKPHTLDAVLSSPSLQTGAYLIIIPGSITPKQYEADGEFPPRRQTGSFFLTLTPSAAAIFNATNNAISLRALDFLASTLESTVLQGRKAHAFTLEATRLPLCSSGFGCCFVWEGSTGKLVIDSALAIKMANTEGLGSFLKSVVSQFGRNLVAWHETQGQAAVSKALLQKELNSSNSSSSSRGNTKRTKSSSSARKDLQEEEQEESDKYTTNNEAAREIVNTLSTTAVAALLSTAATALPLWWCITCPIVLGMLAPFVFNFGLTAAAEELCSALQLTSTTCNDLWWSAFALALVMSLGSAIPIVYVCKLKECGKRHLW